MEKINQNVRDNFKETVGNLEIAFSRVINGAATTFYGKITKNATPVGVIALDTSRNYLNVSFKPFNLTTSEEKQSILEKVAGWTNELINQN